MCVTLRKQRVIDNFISEDFTLPTAVRAAKRGCLVSPGASPLPKAVLSLLLTVTKEKWVLPSPCYVLSWLQETS